MQVKKEHKGLKLFISSEYRSLVSYVRRYFNEKYYNVSAEDIVQDVAVNLFSKLDIDGQFENIAGYVYRSIRNKIADLQRKTKKEITFNKFIDDDGEEHYSENVPNEEETKFNEIDDDIFYDSIHKALDKLSPNQQMVFVATEIDGYTFEELSDELEIPIGTLLSWKHRGVKKLKQVIRPDDFYKEKEKF